LLLLYFGRKKGRNQFFFLALFGLVHLFRG
jgi:hypothetical protein